MPKVSESAEYKPENKTVAVVLVGVFNPLMFQPSWFGTNDIINQTEIDAVIANKANPCIIAPNIALFNTSQLQIQAQENRFSVIGIKESFSMVKDVVKKTFERLGAIPVTAMGINTAAHFKMLNMSKYQAFGDRLSPKSVWQDLLGDNVSGDDRNGDGLTSMQMRNNKDNKGGQFNVLVEPSAKFIPGIYINCNDHYRFDENTDAEAAMQKLDEYFDASIEKSLKIQKSLFKDL